MRSVGPTRTSRRADEPTAEDEFDTDERERRRRSVDDQPTDETKSPTCCERQVSETRDATPLGEANEAALAGGPERHHDKTAEQGKLPVRERVARLLDEGSFSEEARLANWEREGLMQLGDLEPVGQRHRLAEQLSPADHPHPFGPATAASSSASSTDAARSAPSADHRVSRHARRCADRAAAGTGARAIPRSCGP